MVSPYSRGEPLPSEGDGYVLPRAGVHLLAGLVVDLAPIVLAQDHQRVIATRLQKTKTYFSSGSPAGHSYPASKLKRDSAIAQGKVFCYKIEYFSCQEVTNWSWLPDWQMNIPVVQLKNI